jgi:dihydroflavonol-4-reductase
MPVLVTGADGFLGSNVVRQLLAAGRQVRCLVQPGRSSATLAGLAVDIVHGDILDLEQMTAAAAGCEGIIHTAGSTTIWPARAPHIRRINVMGTATVIQAAIFGKVARLVHIGTANSFGFGSKNSPGDETRPYMAGRYGLDYLDSKYEAQQVVLGAVRATGVPAVVVNPTFMLGPYDSGPGSGTMIVRLARGQVPGYAAGGRCYASVRDVATAAVNALEGGEVGRCYICGNENLNYREAFSTICGVLGVRAPSMSFPPVLTKAVGLAGSAAAAVSGRPPTLSYPMASIACDEHYYSSERARRELGLPQTPVAQAVEEAVDWFRRNGYLETPR